MGLNYLFNAFHLILVYKKIWNDQDFLRWQASSLKNKVTNIILVSLSILFAYPLYKLIMSRYFGFSFFKAKIVNIKPFFYFNCLNAFYSKVLNHIQLYITFVNVPILISCILIAYYESSHNTQTFISAIDSIIVTFSNILLLIWETKKGEQFFYEFNQNYYLNESKQHLEKHEISGYFQHPFEQKSQAEQKIDISDMDIQVINQENDVTKQKSQEQSKEHSCNLNGISIILSDKNSNTIFQQKSDRSNSFPQKQVVPSNVKHTIYYKNIQNNQIENPDDEPPYASSENFSSVKSQSNYHCQKSFNDQSQCPLKDISLIQDSEESNENSQLSIFDEEKNKSPLKPQKAVQLIFENDNDENNPQQINQQVEKSQSSSKKTQSQLMNNQGENNLQSNSQSSQSRREIVLQPLQNSLVQYLAKSALFSNEQNKVLSAYKKINQESLSTETNKFQQGVENQENQLVQSKVYQYSEIEQQQKQQINNIKNNDQIHKQNIEHQYLIPSNQIKPKLNDIKEFSQQCNQKDTIENIQLQIGIIDQQAQFDTEGSNDQCRIQILKDSRAIEEDQDIFQDQILIQQMNAENRQYKTKNEQIQKEKIDRESEIKNIFDSNDSIHTMSDQDWGENQISPSEFNSLNQRFENEQELDLQINVPTYSQTQQNYRQSKLKPLDFEFGEENNDEQASIRQTQVEFTKNSKVQKEIKKQQLEKVYLQKLEKNEKVVSRSNKQEFKKKNSIKNHPKDISDAYIDDQIDVEDINF